MANEKNYGDKYEEMNKKVNLQRKLDRLVTQIKQAGYTIQLNLTDRKYEVMED